MIVAREMFLMPCHALNRLTSSLEDYPNFAIKKKSACTGGKGMFTAEWPETAAL